MAGLDRVVQSAPMNIDFTIGSFVALMGAIQLAWYVAVIVLLYKI